jgi:phosphoenolpyruvate phosphomutase
MEFGTKWNGSVPLAAVPTTYPAAKVSELYGHGYRIVIFANQGLRASVAALDRVFRQMVKTQSLLAVEGQISPLSEIFSLVDMEAVRSLESRLMNPKEGGSRRQRPKKRGSS